jgi:hypothetical protein
MHDTRGGYMCIGEFLYLLCASSLPSWVEYVGLKTIVDPEANFITQHPLLASWV